MGFILLFFNQDRWYELYYKNCSLKTLDEWNSEGSSNVLIGTIYLTMGFISEVSSFRISERIVIAPLCSFHVRHGQTRILPAFLLQDHVRVGRHRHCVIPCNGIIGGVQGMLGVHYCSSPVFFYTVGTIAMAGWIMATCTCCILSIDRFLSVVFPHLSKKVLGGKFIYAWLSLPFSYLLYYMFQIPVIYNIRFHAFYFDPFVGDAALSGNTEFFKLHFLIFNSILAVAVMGPCYIILCVYVTVQRYYFKDIENMSKLQKAMLLQSFAVCFEMFFVGSVYVLNQWFVMPEILTKMEHIIWICVHGDTPIVYLLLNESLRKKFFDMLKAYTNKTGKSVWTFATSIYPNNVTQSRVNQLKYNWVVMETNVPIPIERNFELRVMDRQREKY